MNSFPRFALVAVLAWTVALAAVAQIVPSLPVNLQNNTLADANQVMANFNAIVNGVNANAAKNGINTDITALAGLATPITPAQGGSTFYYGGVATGSANAQSVASATPAGFTLTAGYKIAFTAGFTNTGPMTVAYAGTAATAVTRTLRTTIGALGGGEVVAGMIVAAVYDGTQFQLLNTALPQLPGTALNWRGTTAPTGFLFEDGSAVSRTTYAALFAEIGTTYGVGDGATTFNIPDSRGRVNVGRDDMGGVAANRITNAGSGCVGTTLALGCGAENHTMTSGELVAHTHTIGAPTDPGHKHLLVNNDAPAFSAAPTNANQISKSASTGDTFAYAVNGTATAATLGLSASAMTGITNPATTGSTGSTTAFPIIQPLLIANRIIRY